MTPQEFWHYIVSYVKDMTHMSFVNISVFKLGFLALQIKLFDIHYHDW